MRSVLAPDPKQSQERAFSLSVLSLPSSCCLDLPVQLLTVNNAVSCFYGWTANLTEEMTKEEKQARFMSRTYNLDFPLRNIIMFHVSNSIANTTGKLAVKHNKSNPKYKTIIVYINIS